MRTNDDDTLFSKSSMGVYEFKILTIYKCEFECGVSFMLVWISYIFKQTEKNTACVAWITYLNRVEFGAFVADLFGVVISGFVDLQQPGGLRQRPQSVYSIRTLQLLLLQPFLQITDVASKQTEKL